MRNSDQVLISCCYWPVGIDLRTFTIIIQKKLFVFRVRRLLARPACFKIKLCRFCGHCKKFWRGSTMEEHWSTHFELKTIVINESTFPKLLWAGLVLRSLLVFLRVWNVLINTVMIKGSYFFYSWFGSVVCPCCLLVYFRLGSEPREELNDYHPWVNWTADLQGVTVVGHSVRLSVWTVRRPFFSFVKRGWL